MKVIFAYVDRLNRMFPVASFRDVIRKLPCEVVECHDFASIKKHAADADVFICQGTTMVPLTREQQQELMRLFGDRVFKGNTSLDPWEAKQPAYREIKWDFTTSFCKEKWNQLRKYNVFWLPNACDVREYDCEQDIDVLLWGTINSKYPFRVHVAQMLRKLVVGAGEPLDECVTIYPIRIGGRQYKYAILSPGTRYYSEELYKLIARSKVCPTGPHGNLIPLGKYVEHAACGAVSLTPKFTDMEELGFEHGANIWVTGYDTFLSDLQYLLEHPDVTRTLSHNAKQLIRERHTTEIRAKELYPFLRDRGPVVPGEVEAAEEAIPKLIIGDITLDLDKVVVQCSHSICARDLYTLYQVADPIAPQNILEIGGAWGCSSMVLGAVARKHGGHLYTIEAQPHEKWRENIDSLGLQNNVTMIPGYSPWVSLPDEAFPLDLLLIDGNHEVPSIITDYRYWWHYVKKGGLIVFHDWLHGGAAQDVQTAVALIRKADNLKLIAESVSEQGIVVFMKL